jgi:ATP-dependent Clp protease protease subunit
MNGIKMVKRVNPINIEEKIDSGLLQNSTNFLVGEIDYETTKRIIKWIVYENTLSTKTPLTLYINSHGGSLLDAFALIEVMKKSKRKIRTIGIGSVMSAGFLIFVSGSKGERYITKTSSILCHQLTTEIEGKHHDINSYYKESERNGQNMVDILSQACDLDKNEIKKLLLPPTDVWLTANEMIQFKLADKLYEDLK